MGPRKPVTSQVLTGTRQNVGVILVGAQESHKLRRLHVFHGEEADVVLGVGNHYHTPNLPSLQGLERAGSQI